MKQEAAIVESVDLADIRRFNDLDKESASDDTKKWLQTKLVYDILARGGIMHHELAEKLIDSKTKKHYSRQHISYLNKMWASIAGNPGCQTSSITLDNLGWWHKAYADAKKGNSKAKEPRAMQLLSPAIISRHDGIEWLKDQHDVDLLLTDPPYMTDVEDIRTFAGWLESGLACLKDTGRAYVCIGAYPDELHAYMSVSMPTQVLVWTYRNTIGPSPANIYKQNWQAILYYAMPNAQPLDCANLIEQFSVQDINAPDARHEIRYHTWEKPMDLASRFVRHSTQQGGTMIDPFAGTGTFLLAAANYGLEATGCDTDQDMIDIAISRGCTCA